MPPESWYNEPDPGKAAWLRELIAAGVIAPGVVDERSIQDVRPAELVRFTQCHFFAGIGVWSYALRLAGWPDDRPVWTGSCPCPSFSVAGKGEGFDDPRHLWPAWIPLVRECRPRVLFGEQADGAIGHGWLDLVHRDLEAAGYAVAPAVLGAHSAGAPHIRQRLYFVAHASQRGSWPHDGEPGPGVQQEGAAGGRGVSSHGSDATGERYDGRGSGEASHAFDKTIRDGAEREPERPRDAGHSPNPDGWQPSDGGLQRGGEQRLQPQDHGACPACGFPRSGYESSWQWAGGKCPECGADLQGGGRGAGIADHAARKSDAEWSRGAGKHGNAPERGFAVRRELSGTAGHAARAGEPGGDHHAERTRPEGHIGDERDGDRSGRLDSLASGSTSAAGATRGFWRGCDWWYGRDGKYRPIGKGIRPLLPGAVKSGLLALADGAAAYMGLVRFPRGGEAHGPQKTVSAAPEPETSEARVLRLRGYGDAIVAPLAAEFIRAYLDVDCAREP